MRSFSGHLRTVFPHLRHAVRPVLATHRQEYRTEVMDPQRGPIPLHGWWAPAHNLLGEPREDAEISDLVVLLHGLGGSAESLYVHRYGADFQRQGVSVLAFGMRGSGPEPTDLYHSGLTDDLQAVLRSPEVVRAQNVYLLGFSVGGHLSLSVGCEDLPENVRAITAICPPLSLGVAREHIDAGAQKFYRRHVLSGLKRMACRVAEALNLPLAPIEAARSIREFDAATVVPRFGFLCPDHYAEVVSVAPRLPGLRRPALVVGTDGDPMVPIDLIRKHLPTCGAVESRFVRGGHVWVPDRLDLGMDAPTGLAAQTLAWFRRQVG